VTRGRKRQNKKQKKKLAQSRDFSRHPLRSNTERENKGKTEQNRNKGGGKNQERLNSMAGLHNVKGKKKTRRQGKN